MIKRKPRFAGNNFARRSFVLGKYCERERIAAVVMEINGIEIQAAIFDFDGTLADSLGVWNDIDIKFFENHAMALPPTYQSEVKSMDFDAAAAYTKKRYGFLESESEIIEQWRKMACDEYAYNIELKPGAGRFIAALANGGVKLGLATASGRELFEPMLKRCGVYDLFSAFVTTTQVGKDKSHPDVYIECAKRLHCPIKQCMVFEDLLASVLAAKSAGMYVTGVYDSHSAHDEKRIRAAADFYIDDYDAALQKLK